MESPDLPCPVARQPDMQAFYEVEHKHFVHGFTQHHGQVIIWSQGNLRDFTRLNIDTSFGGLGALYPMVRTAWE